MRVEVACAAALLLASCHHESEAEEAPHPKRVRCAAVEAKMVTDRIEVRGSVQPPMNADAQVAPQVSGRLLSVDVKEGDAVKVGQLLARVDDAPLGDAVRKAGAAVERARADRENAETTLQRAQRVFDKGIAPRQEVDDAAARQAAARATEAEAAASAHEANRELERAHVKSPLSGVVIKVFRRPGELVDGTPATPVVEVADISHLELVADVPAQDLIRLTNGANATITFPAIPGRVFEGSVSMVSPTVDRTTGVGAARMSLHDSVPPPPVGVYGIARIGTGGSRTALLVPSGAVRNAVGESGEVVLCGPDNVAHVHKVKLGTAEGGVTEIADGIGAQDHVAVDPVLGLSEGDKLEVTH